MPTKQLQEMGPAGHFRGNTLFLLYFYCFVKMAEVPWIRVESGVTFGNLRQNSEFNKTVKCDTIMTAYARD